MYRPFDYSPAYARSYTSNRGANSLRTSKTSSPGLSKRFSVSCCFARRMQDIESDTGNDTLMCLPDGVLTRVSQTAVYDTC